MSFITTVDGRRAYEGDAVFNHYDREVGTFVEGSLDSDGWYEFLPQGSQQKKSLNGERTLSMRKAELYGWVVRCLEVTVALPSRPDDPLVDVHPLSAVRESDPKIAAFFDDSTVLRVEVESPTGTATYCLTWAANPSA